MGGPTDRPHLPISEMTVHTYRLIELLSDQSLVNLASWILTFGEVGQKNLVRWDGQPGTVPEVNV